MEHGDIDAVLLLFDAVTAEGIWIGTEPGYDRERYGELFGFALGNGNGMFVATIDERLVGVITEYRHSDYGHTLGMLVDEQHRGIGIGRALLEQLIAWASARGLPHLSLLVFPHNERARALYRASGFLEIERLPASVARANGEAWDSILMRKTLS
jgi:ribosomal protein S18 acetylase RimI-like enzyme